MYKKPGQNISYGNIELNNAASIDTCANSAGHIQVRGANININNGSVIVSDTLGNGACGQLTVNASESLRLQGVVFNPASNIIFSSILGDVGKIEAQRFGVDTDGGIALIAFNTVSTPQPAPTNYQCSQH